MTWSIARPLCNSWASCFHCVCAEDFALSIHDGLTSTDPVLATVWGTNVAQASVEDRCFNSNGTVPTSAATTTTRDTVSTYDDAGNDTVLVGLRGFYVRLRGNLHAKDRVVIDCWTQRLLDPCISTCNCNYCRIHKIKIQYIWIKT